MKRITIDWDFKERKKCLFYLNKILYARPKGLIIKPSRRGYHVFIWFADRQCNSKKKRKELRLRFGDDKNRLRLDQGNRIGKETLFSKKARIKR